MILGLRESDRIVASTTNSPPRNLASKGFTYNLHNIFMKTFLKICLVLFVLFVVLVGTGFFILTRPGVQKKLVEGQLPEGSSIGTVRVTTSSLELSELKLVLADGTRVRLAMFDTDFKPLDALFDKTLKLGALNVEGLVVEVPQALIQSPTPSEPSGEAPGPATTGPKKPADAGEAKEVAAPGEASGSPADALYAVGQLEWLIDIDSIKIDGELRDGAGSSYAMNLRSGAIRPGEETSVEASLKLNSREALHAGLTKFDANAQIFLKQNTGGGFEQVRVESLTSASDRGGNNLLTASQNIDLSVQAFEEQATLALDFTADLPRPEIFLPEMTGVGPMNLQGSMTAEARGDELTLSGTDLLVSAKGEEVVSVKLNKHFTLGAKKDLSGNLMDVRISGLPLAWLGPWLPEGLMLTGEDLSAQLNLTGTAAGGLELSSTAAIKLGPLSLSQDGAPLLDTVTLQFQPIIRLASDQSIFWELNEFEVQDRYGAILSAQSTGQYKAAAATKGFLPAGLTTATTLELGLQEITQQPALAASTSILTGRASLSLSLDPSNEYPLQAQGKITGLSPRAYPGQKQDFQFALQLNEPEEGVLALGANLQAGSENRPSSNLQFAGQVRPDLSPLEFKADLSASRLSQGDIEFLTAAFQPGQPATPSVPEDAAIAPPSPSTSSPDADRSQAELPRADPAPPWAGYDGELALSIEELVLLSGEVISGLKAELFISEPLLSLKNLEGSLQGGKLSGSGEVRFSQRQRMAYAIKSDLRFENVDPAMFSKKSSKNFPVHGLFDGEAEFAGQGATLEKALEELEGELTVNGREGVLTAFELDSRSNLGLIGAGLLGQSLNRPGLTAMAQAVPYFENMPFSDFTLKLTRGADKHIKIPQLKFTGRNLLIDGSGSIAATSLKEAMSQPLDLTLELGAKGRLIDSLETLGLLGPNTGEDGFRLWNSAIQIKGSLSDPDTSALERILKQAANRALREPSEENKAPVDQEGEAPSEPSQQPEPSKEEKILRDVGTGLNLLFGE